MSCERRASEVLVAQLRTDGVSDQGYELATPFLHGGRQFLQALRPQIRIFTPKNEHFDVQSASESERDSSRNPSRKCVQNSGAYARGTAHGSGHRSDPKV